MPRGSGIANIVHLFLHFMQFLKRFLHTVLWYRVFLSNANRLINETLTDTNTLGQSEPESNGNEALLHTHQISKTRESPSNAILCHVKDDPFLGVVQPLYREYSQPILSPADKIINNFTDKRSIVNLREVSIVISMQLIYLAGSTAKGTGRTIPRIRWRLPVPGQHNWRKM